MNMELGNFVLGIIGAAAGAIGAYVAVRSDIAHLKAAVERAITAADRANDRIDRMFGSTQRINN